MPKPLKLLFGPALHVLQPVVLVLGVVFGIGTPDRPERLLSEYVLYNTTTVDMIANPVLFRMVSSVNNNMACWTYSLICDHIDII